MDAIILAGSSEKSLNEFGVNKSLIKFRGIPLLDIIAEALKRADMIDRIFLITDIDRSKSGKAGEIADALIKSTGDVIEDVVSCINKYDIVGNFLATAADLPFISAEAVDGFIAKSDLSCNLNYSAVSKHDFEAMFPAYKKTYVRLSDGIFTSGCMFIATAKEMIEGAEIPRMFFAKRKSPIKLVSLIGFSGVIRFISGMMSFAYLRDMFKSRTGYSVSIVDTGYPELAMDVDNVEQLKYLELLAAKITDESGTDDLTIH